MNRILSLLLFVVILHIQVQSQVMTISTSNNITPASLNNYVNNILISSGITSDYISYSGKPEQIGYLSVGGAQAGLPFESGIVLSSGAGNGLNNITGGVNGPWTLGGVSSPVWPATFSPATQVCYSIPCTPSGAEPNISGLLATQAQDVDDQLLALGLYTGLSFMPANVAINDMVILEFDFIPSGPLMSFEYIFGSNEYTGYEYTQFNDIFGFFVSGPNVDPTLPNYNNLNIASVPGYDPPLPITISTINNDAPAINSQYYNNNNPAVNPINARGFTDILTASLDVIPCQTYHIVLAVADCGDSGFDTFVILKENSLLSIPDVTVNLNINGSSVTNNLIFEECGQPVLHVEYDPSVTPTAFADIVWGGTPIAFDGTNLNNYDYAGLDGNGNLIPLPANINLTPTSPFMDIIITAINDNIAEGLETIQLQILTPVAGCSGLYNSQGQDIIINDLPPLELSFDSLAIMHTIDFDTLYLACNNQTPLPYDLVGGDANYTFSWEDESGEIGTNSTLVYDGAVLGEGSISLTVNDGCNQTITDELQVQFPHLEFSVGNDFVGNCQDPHTVVPTNTSGTPTINYQWYADGELLFSTNQTNNTPVGQTLTFNDTTVVLVNGIDLCGQTWHDDMTFFIPDAPLDITNIPDTSVCLYGNATFTAEVTGGGGGYVIEWPQLNVMGASAGVYNILGDVTQIVQAEDVCGSMAYDTINIHMMPVSANFEATMLDENIYEFVSIPCEGCTYTWDMGDDFTSEDTALIHEFDGLDAYTVHLNVVNEIGCTDDQEFTVTAPAYFYIPSGFTPNGDGINDAFGLVIENVDIYELTVFNRWGEIVHYSNDPLQTWIGDVNQSGTYYAPNGVYSYRLKIKGKNKDAQTIHGNITILR
jgi:gliding motility-associated-like protein